LPPANPAALAAPQETAQPEEASHAPRQTSPFDVVEDSATAQFNIAQGAKIADFIQKHAVKARQKTGDGAAAGEAKAAHKKAQAAAKPDSAALSESSAPAKKIGPVPQIKKIQFKSTGSTSIQPSPVSGSGTGQ
jgi:hypothetical protein